MPLAIKVHLFIIYTAHLLRVTGKPEPIAADLWREAGLVSDRSSIYPRDGNVSALFFSDYLFQKQIT